jgi:hypothetical protein
MKNQIGKYLVKMLALVLGIAGAQSAPAQTFKRVKVYGGAALAQIAAGGASVWARASNGNPYILKGKQFVLANSISLTQIAVGGGNALQADTVWGLDSSGNIYKATKSGTTWVFSQAPGVLEFIAVGPGYTDNCHPYEVWGLYAASIYRYNFCIQNWDFVPGSLASLAVGGGDIWGINGNGQLFEFNFDALSFLPSTNLSIFTQVTAGPNGAWALSSGGPWQFANLSTWSSDYIAEYVTQIQAGGNGVWGISYAQVFRLEPSKLSFLHIPGATLFSISVGSGGGVWGLDSSGKAYGFTTP